MVGNIAMIPAIRLYLNDDGHFESSCRQSTVQPVAHHSLRETGTPALLDVLHHLSLTLLEQVGLKLTYKYKQLCTQMAHMYICNVYYAHCTYIYM